ncbi:MAG: RNA polymerase sigma-70 factor [Ferruginibacter sp.]|nr:RNA polymerase sigma-70 factor [Cytophagales bacterium]
MPEALAGEDNHLFAQVQRGDRQAFATLYRRYWRKFYGFAYNAIRSESEAEDVVQELFADFWLNRQQWTRPTSVNAFFYSILRNRILDHIRKQQVREKYVIRIRQTSLDTDNSTLETLLAQELEERLREEIKELPERCREIFELSRFQCYSVEEIAQRLSLSPQTVKNQLTKALGILRTNLSDYALFVVVCLTMPS